MRTDALKVATETDPSINLTRPTQRSTVTTRGHKVCGHWDCTDIIKVPTELNLEALLGQGTSQIIEPRVHGGQDGEMGH
jgi:hypothetical protein